MKRIWALGLVALALAGFTACGAFDLGSSSDGNNNGGSNGGGSGSVTKVNHIVFMLQENRSFDHYFGSLNAYRTSKGLGADVNGIPADFTNPAWDGNGTVAPFHATTVCFEGLSPSWNASRRDVNRYNPSPTAASAPMDGFVYSAAHYAQDSNALGGNYVDTAGLRAMSYYTDADLPYYYFMATQFATSDSFFSPILSRTPPNRIATFAASALGIVDAIPTGTTFTHDTIFSLLQNAGVSWKIYETSGNTYLAYFSSFYKQYKGSNIFPIDQYFTDLKNGTLPQFAFIETGVETNNDATGTSSLDEHPNANIQKGAQYVSTLINGLMNSSSWKDSVFILTFDEGGGTFDHVAPKPAAIPDDIQPMLKPTDNPDTYSRTGFRIPMIVVSPFTRKGYVSHTVMDTTAVLRFVEERFNLPQLSARDAAQPSMDEFFDFGGAPNATPPSNIPTQPTNGSCLVHSITP